MPGLGKYFDHLLEDGYGRLAVIQIVLVNFSEPCHEISSIVDRPLMAFQCRAQCIDRGLGILEGLDEGVFGDGLASSLARRCGIQSQRVEGFQELLGA